MLITNTKNNEVLARNAFNASTFGQRLIGLSAAEAFEEGKALLLSPCNMIHTIGMKFALDVIFITKDGVAKHIIENMKPCSISPLVFGARKTLELPAGTVSRTGTTVGDVISIVEQPAS